MSKIILEISQYDEDKPNPVFEQFEYESIDEAIANIEFLKLGYNFFANKKALIVRLEQGKENYLIDYYATEPIVALERDLIEKYPLFDLYTKTTFDDIHTLGITNSNFGFTDDGFTNYATTSTGHILPFKLFHIDDVHPENIKLNSNNNSDFALVERRFSEFKSIQFLGEEKINNHNDVAWLFNALEDEAVEHAFLVYHFANSSYFVQHISSGAIDQTTIDNRLIIGNILKAKPTSITLVHNHPSGVLKASPDDIRCIQQFRDALLYSDIVVNPGVIINLRSGKYLVFDSSSEDILTRTQGERILTDVKSYSFSKQIYIKNYQPQSINSPEEIAMFISSKKFGISDKTEMLVLNNQLHILGKFIMPPKDQLNFIVDKITNYGGSKCILFGNNVSTEEVEFYNKRLKHSGMSIMDAFLFKSENGVKLFESLSTNVQTPIMEITSGDENLIGEINENFNELKASILKKLERVFVSPEDRNHYFLVEDNDVKLTNVKWTDWGKMETKLTLNEAKDEFLKSLTLEEKDLVTTIIDVENRVDAEEHDDPKYTTLRIRITENNLINKTMENNLSWTERNITPKTKAYKDFVINYEKTPEKISKEGEKEMSDRDEKFLEIYNYRKGLVPETQSEIGSNYELLTYDNDNFLTNNENFISTAETVKALENLDFSNNSYMLVDNDMGLFEKEINSPADRELLISDFYAQELSKRTDLSSGFSINQIDEKQAYHYRNFEAETNKLSIDITDTTENIFQKYLDKRTEMLETNNKLLAYPIEQRDDIQFKIYQDLRNELFNKMDAYVDRVCESIDMSKQDFYSQFDLYIKQFTKEGREETLYQEIDLFKNYEFISENLREVYDKWMEIESSKGFEYKDCEEFLKECEAIGYTFEYQLDAQPLYLRPINLEDQLILKDKIEKGIDQNKAIDPDSNSLTSFGKDSDFIDDLFDDIENRNGDLWKKNDTEIIGGKIKDIAEASIKNPEYLKQFDQNTQNTINLFIKNQSPKIMENKEFKIQNLNITENQRNSYNDFVEFGKDDGKYVLSQEQKEQIPDEIGSLKLTPMDKIHLAINELRIEHWGETYQIQDNKILKTSLNEDLQENKHFLKENEIIINNQNPKIMEQNVDKEEKKSQELEVGRFANIKNSEGSIDFKGTIKSIGDNDVTLENKNGESHSAPKEQVYQYFYGQKHDLSEVKEMLDKKLPANLSLSDFSSKDMSQLMKGEQTDTLFKGVKEESGKDPIEYEFKLILRYDSEKKKVVPKPEWKDKDFVLSQSKIFGQDLPEDDRAKLANGDKLIMTTVKGDKEIHYKVAFDDKLNSVIALGFVNQKPSTETKESQEVKKEVKKKNNNNQKV